MTVTTYDAVLDFTGHEPAIDAAVEQRLSVLALGSRRSRVNPPSKLREDLRRAVVSETAVAVYTGGQLEPWRAGRIDGGVDVRVAAGGISVKSALPRSRAHLYVRSNDPLAADGYVLALVAVGSSRATLVGWCSRGDLQQLELRRFRADGPLNRIVPCSRGCHVCGERRDVLRPMPDLLAIVR